MDTRLLFGVTLISMKWGEIWCKNIETGLLPCAFEDSINITGGTISPGNSVLFDGIKYSKENFGTFYTTINRTNIIGNSHLRGCPCNIKPCLRLCCPLGSFVNTNQLKRGSILQEIPCYHHEGAKNYHSEVFDQTTNQSEMQILDKYFSYVVLTAPKKFYKLKNYQITNVIAKYSLRNYSCCENIFKDEKFDYVSSWEIFGTTIHYWRIMSTAPRLIWMKLGTPLLCSSCGYFSSFDLWQNLR